jgi:hypothetical protein
MQIARAPLELVAVPEGSVLQLGTERFVVSGETAVFIGAQCFVTKARFVAITGIDPEEPTT